MIINGTSGVTFPNSTVQATAAQSYRTRVLSTGTTYTVPSDVRALYVFVVGATGGRPANTTAYGGRGGQGYSETYYATPAASYSYSIGAAGAITPTAGGTTTFGAMSVTGGGAVSTTAGGTGGIGSGGTFNATGGAGGTTSTGIGGSGGAGSRAGNGGTGGNGGASLGGGGGGTGGNNASLATGGSAGTLSGSAISLSAIFPSGTTETFDAGATTATANAGDGATNQSNFDALVAGAFFPLDGLANYASESAYRLPNGGNTSGTGALTGTAGVICIIEVL